MLFRSSASSTVRSFSVVPAVVSTLTTSARSKLAAFAERLVAESSTLKVMVPRVSSKPLMVTPWVASALFVTETDIASPRRVVDEPATAAASSVMV